MQSTPMLPMKPDEDMTAKCSMHRLGLCTVKKCAKDCAEGYSLDEIIEEVKSWG